MRFLEGGGDRRCDVHPPRFQVEVAAGKGTKIEPSGGMLAPRSGLAHRDLRVGVSDQRSNWTIEPWAGVIRIGLDCLVVVTGHRKYHGPEFLVGEDALVGATRSAQLGQDADVIAEVDRFARFALVPPRRRAPT